MKHLFEAAQELQEFCLGNNWKFCFIGGLAVQCWAEPRITQDVDLTILTGIRDEEKFVSALLSKYQPRINDALEFALTNRVLLLKTPNNIGIDISLAALPYEEKLISRASYQSFINNIQLLLCSPEDLIVMKIFAERPKDLIDAENVMIRQGKKLDVEYIREQLTDLAELKEEPELLNIFNKLLKEYL